jgi:hypothetical protein
MKNPGLTADVVIAAIEIATAPLIDRIQALECEMNRSRSNERKIAPPSTRTIWRGEWSASKSYESGSLVEHRGQLWRAVCSANEAPGGAAGQWRAIS